MVKLEEDGGKWDINDFQLCLVLLQEPAAVDSAAPVSYSDAADQGAISGTEKGALDGWEGSHSRQFVKEIKTSLGFLVALRVMEMSSPQCIPRNLVLPHC